MFFPSQTDPSIKQPVNRSAKRRALWAAVAVLTGGMLLAGCSRQSGTAQADASAQPAQGGTLVYLEQQAHTNLYPPAGGFYPNGGVLNQITDKLTYQDPETLEIQPWIAESWTVNADATEYSFKLRSGVSFSDGSPLDAAAVARDDAAHVGQTDAGALEILGAVQALEDAEQLAHVFHVEADAVVGDADHPLGPPLVLPALGGDVDLGPLPLARVLEGVAHQIGQCLEQQFAVTVQSRPGRTVFTVRLPGATG